MSDNKHLQVDLEFLDKDEPVHAKAPETTSRPPSNPTKYNWKGILIAVGVVIIIGAISDSGSSTKSSSSSNSQTDSVSVGNYHCSSYNKSQADALNPTDVESRQLDAETQNLKDRAAAIKVSSDQIDSMTVDNTDQDSLDYYNQQVNIHNAKLDTYKTDAASHEAKIANYNTRVEKYNNYLDAHCTRDN